MTAGSSRDVGKNRKGFVTPITQPRIVEIDTEATAADIRLRLALRIAAAFRLVAYLWRWASGFELGTNNERRCCAPIPIILDKRRGI
jgi:hypothetical protein